MIDLIKEDQVLFMTPESILVEHKMDISSITLTGSIYEYYSNLFKTVFSCYKRFVPNTRLSVTIGSGELQICEASNNPNMFSTKLEGIDHDILISLKYPSVRKNIDYGLETFEPKTINTYFIINTDDIDNVVIPYLLDKFLYHEKELSLKTTSNNEHVYDEYKHGKSNIY